MLATLLIATTFIAAADQKQDSTPVEPLKLTGCVSTKPGVGGDYTFTNGDGSRYRLTGKDVRKYAGKKVEVVEGSSKGFQIKGGLYPSPNVAAQAGGLDPVEAGIATQPGSGVRAPSGQELPEFRAGRVRAVPGECQ